MKRMRGYLWPNSCPTKHLQNIFFIVRLTPCAYFGLLPTAFVSFHTLIFGKVITLVMFLLSKSSLCLFIEIHLLRNTIFFNEGKLLLKCSETGCTFMSSFKTFEISIFPKFCMRWLLVLLLHLTVVARTSTFSLCYYNSVKAFCWTS